MIRILTLIVALSGLTALAASAAPVGYDLQPDRSEVGFIYTLNGTDYRGTMPVVSADITIDFQRFSASSVDVTVDVTGARTGLIFVTEALKAASGLDARNHPTIRFQSTAVRANAGQLLGGRFGNRAAAAAACRGSRGCATMLSGTRPALRVYV